MLGGTHDSLNLRLASRYSLVSRLAGTMRGIRRLLKTFPRVCNLASPANELT